MIRPMTSLGRVALAAMGADDDREAISSSLRHLPSVKKIPASEILESFNTHFRRPYFLASSEVHRLNSIISKRTMALMARIDDRLKEGGG